MKKRGFVKSVIVVSAILLAAFLSQSASFRPIAKHIYATASKTASPYITRTDEWFRASISPRISQEAEKRGEGVKAEVIKQKDTIVKTVWEKFKNYFAKKFYKFSGTEVE